MKEKQVVKHYNDVLKIIENAIGKEITDENQLRSLGKDLFGKTFTGVYAVDKLPILQNKQCCIINLDKSYENGSHWVSIYKHNSKYCIYDSFGRQSSKILSSLKKLKIRDSDYDPEQKIAENNCGQRSMAWLWCINDIGIENALKI
jgi:hypothetical protein